VERGEWRSFSTLFCDFFLYNPRKPYHFPIIIEHDSNGYFVSCPALQGCYTQGDTYEEAMRNIADAVQLYIEDVLARGGALPDV
jgi:predicted RNase H-like HicB family nuclease